MAFLFLFFHAFHAPVPDALLAHLHGSFIEPSLVRSCPKKRLLLPLNCYNLLPTFLKFIIVQKEG